MGKVTVVGGKPAMEAPSAGIVLSTIAEGSVVKLNESGTPAEFYVAKHNYESGLNGAGRTLLVRRDCYTTIQFNTSSPSVLNYSTSNLHSWFNSTYKALLDSAVVSAIGTTKFYYTNNPGGLSQTSKYTLATMSAAIFALSLTELGRTDSYAKTEGSALPIASLCTDISYNYSSNAGTYGTQHTRTLSSYKANYVYTIWYEILRGTAYVTVNQSISNGHDLGARPCFTLPSASVFDEKTLLFKGVL